MGFYIKLLIKLRDIQKKCSKPFRIFLHSPDDKSKSDTLGFLFRALTESLDLSNYTTLSEISDKIYARELNLAINLRNDVAEICSES